MGSRGVRRLATLALLAAVALMPATGPFRTAAAVAPHAWVLLEETSSTCTFGRLDLATGAVTTIGTVGGATCADSLTVAPDGTLLGLSNQGLGNPLALVRYDVTTGVATTIGDTSVMVLLAAGGIAFDDDGALWLYIQTLNPECTGFSCLYRVDPATAATTFVGTNGSETIVDGLAGLCDGRVVTIHGVPPQQLASVDTGSGALDDLGPTDPSQFVNGLATEADGTLWGLANPTVGTGTRIVRIDPDGPKVVQGPLVAEAPLAFAIDPLTCPDDDDRDAHAMTPATAPPTTPVVVAPTFTG